MKSEEEVDSVMKIDNEVNHQETIQQKSQNNQDNLDISITSNVSMLSNDRVSFGKIDCQVSNARNHPGRDSAKFVKFDKSPMHNVHINQSTSMTEEKQAISMMNNASENLTAAQVMASQNTVQNARFSSSSQPPPISPIKERRVSNGSSHSENSHASKMSSKSARSMKSFGNF